MSSCKGLLSYGVYGDNVMDHLEQSEARVPVKGARFGLGSTSCHEGDPSSKSDMYLPQLQSSHPIHSNRSLYHDLDYLLFLI